MSQPANTVDAHTGAIDVAVTHQKRIRLGSDSVKTSGSVLSYPFRLAAALFALSFFFVGSLFLGLFVLPFIAVLSLVARRKPYDFCRRFVHVGFLWYLKMTEVLRLLKFRYIPLEGAPDLRGKPYVAVANHPSLLDTPVMGAFLGPVTFTIRHTAARFTVSIASYLCGYLPIRVGSLYSAEDFLSAAAARIRRNEPIMMFPEGTRSPLDDIHRFIRIPFDVAARTGVPLRVFAIRCHPRMLTKEKSVFRWPVQVVQYDIVEIARLDVDPTPAAARKARDEAYRRIREALSIS